MKPRNTSFMVEDILGLNRGKDRFKSTTKQRGEICNIIGERGADKTLLKSDVKSKGKTTANEFLVLICVDMEQRLVFELPSPTND